MLEILQKGGWIIYPIIFVGLIGLTIIIERIIFFTKNQLWTLKLIKKNNALNIDQINEKYKNCDYKETLESLLQNDLQLFINKLEKGLGLLAGIGSIAPLMGFLGTVTGMIDAFASIANASSVNAKVVASGIQEALITTATGLFVAVPVLIAYYLFLNIVQNIVNFHEQEIQKICKNKKSILVENH